MIDAKGRATGNFGCNRFTAETRTDGDTITVRQATTTAMGCEKDAERFEKAMSRAFGGELTVAVTGRNLTLTTATGDSIALTSEPPAPLTGTTWTVTSLVSGTTTSSLPENPENAERKARLTFGEDGSVRGTLGCNSFRGTAEVTGSTITFGPADGTKMMCPDPGMKLERALLAILDGRTTYRIDHRTLSLTAANGEGLRAVPQARRHGSGMGPAPDAAGHAGKAAVPTAVPKAASRASRCEARHETRVRSGSVPGRRPPHRAPPSGPAGRPARMAGIRR